MTKDIEQLLAMFALVMVLIFLLLCVWMIYDFCHMTQPARIVSEEYTGLQWSTVVRCSECEKKIVYPGRFADCAVEIKYCPFCGKGFEKTVIKDGG